jgi:hypothetical protein
MESRLATITAAVMKRGMTLVPFAKPALNDVFPVCRKRLGNVFELRSVEAPLGCEIGYREAVSLG